MSPNLNTWSHFVRLNPLCHPLVYERMEYTVDMLGLKMFEEINTLNLSVAVESHQVRGSSLAHKSSQEEHQEQLSGGQKVV